MVKVFTNSQIHTLRAVLRSRISMKLKCICWSDLHTCNIYAKWIMTVLSALSQRNM